MMRWWPDTGRRPFWVRVGIVLAALGVGPVAGQELPGIQTSAPPVPQLPIFVPSSELPPALAPQPIINEIKPSSVAPESSPITLRAEDEDIRKVLALLAEQAGVNILPSAAVTGNVTLLLKGVSFDEALEILTKVGNLGIRREGKVFYAYSADELNAIEKNARIPIMKVYKLSYLRVSDLAPILAQFKSPEGTISSTPLSGGSGGGASGSGGSSSKYGGATSIAASGLGGAAGGGGGIPVGPSGGATSAGSTVETGEASGGNSLAGSDTIVVRDYAENLAQMDEIVAQLDVQPLQVLIEAVILSVQLDDTQQLGINFGLVDNLRNTGLVAGNGALINGAAGFNPAKVLSTAANGASFTTPRPGLLDAGLAVADQGLKFGFIDKNVSGFIRAIETMNKVNILASPRVLVLNKQRAEIQIGQRLGYRNTVVNLTSSLQTVQFLSVGTLLNLRPFVSQDGMIRMEIHPEKSTGQLDAAGVPQTVTSELTTNIMVPDGATIVIGGLIDSSDTLGQAGVLGLSRLPVVGPLFRERITKATKTELIVLLTPRILNRSNLPGPSPGLPPRGPSGLPNSGPMPGPSLRSFEPVSALSSSDPVARLRRLTTEPSNAVFSALDLESGPTSVPSSVRDGGLRQSGLISASTDQEASPRTASGERPKSETTPAPRSASYRPGDLTRATFDRLRQGFATRPANPRNKAPLARSSDRIGEKPSPRPEAVMQAGGVDQHVVRVGESFASIAQEVYGSASLRGALWSVNRHAVASPDALEPGQTILLPPTDVLDRMILEATGSQKTLLPLRTAEPAVEASARPKSMSPRYFPTRWTRSSTRP